MVQQQQPEQEQPVEACVQHGKLPAHPVPPAIERLRPPSLPKDEQKAHLEQGEDDELEKRRGDERVEQGLDEDARGEVEQAQVRVH